jgi:hypothetical protein
LFKESLLLLELIDTSNPLNLVILIYNAVVVCGSAKVVLGLVESNIRPGTCLFRTSSKSARERR